MLKNSNYVYEVSRNAKQGNSSLDRELLSRDIPTHSLTEKNQIHRKHKPHVRKVSQSSICSTGLQQAELLCQLSSALHGSLTSPEFSLSCLHLPQGVSEQLKPMDTLIKLGDRNRLFLQGPVIFLSV